jgi:ankyrin repeat protein
MRCLVEEFSNDVNRASFVDGATPVQVASWNGHLCLVRYLVKLGADVKKADAKGGTPLYVAAQNGNLEIVQCLLKESGADVNQAAIDGSTPLMVSALCGHVAVVRCLVREHGAVVNQGNKMGSTALTNAAKKGHLAVVKCLVEEFGADVNQAKHDGLTPLIMASLGQHDKIIRWLIRHGADVQAVADNGTAVDASRALWAPIAQTEYLEAKAHCSNPGCSGAGLKKCTVCKQARYCGQSCQLAHWKAHKDYCKANKKA